MLFNYSRSSNNNHIIKHLQIKSQRSRSNPIVHKLSNQDPQFNSSRMRSLLGVDKPTILPDLSFIPIKYVNIPHLYHRIGKRCEEKLLIRGISPHLLSYLPLMIFRHQHVIGPQQPSSLKNVEEIVVVKSSRGFKIKRSQLIVFSCFWTYGP